VAHGLAGTWFDSGTYRSTDQGVSWQEVGLREIFINDMVITSDGAVFVSNAQGAVYRSQDNGTTWQLSGENLVSNGGALAYDPVQDILYAATFGGLWRSTDGGDSWQEMSTGVPFVTIEALAVIPAGGPLYVGTDGEGVHRSLDGGIQWERFDSGMTAITVEDFLVVPEGDIYAASYGEGIYRTAWQGTYWTRLNQGLTDDFYLAIERDESGRLWAGTVTRGACVSTDGGAHWSPANNGIEYQAIPCLLALGSNEILVGSEGGGVSALRG